MIKTFIVVIFFGLFIESSSVSTLFTRKRCNTNFRLQSTYNPFTIEKCISNSVSLLLFSSLLCLNSNPFTDQPKPVFASSVQEWNQAKYLDEEDNNRIKQVAYSKNGLYMTGIDINGNEFAVDLSQSSATENSNGINLLFAPLAIIPIVAAAIFSSSSEGRAMKTMTMTDDEKAATATLSADDKDIQSMDRTYEFNSFQQGIDDINSMKTPSYLLSALLAGLFYLPPESLLKTQSDDGRRVRYKSYRSIQPLWRPIGSSNDSNAETDFGSVEYADISRLSYPSSPEKGVDGVLGKFRLYRFKLTDESATPLNCNLSKRVIYEASTNLGIAVSNAGGYHSTKDYFKNIDNNPAVNELSMLAYKAAAIAEAHDYQQSITTANDVTTISTVDNSQSNYIRSFQSPQSQDEAWVNVNKDGHWNRLHTHEGAAWSGVYWIQSHVDSLQRRYSGQLLLKPTSHIKERIPLNTLELNRLGVTSREEKDMNGRSATAVVQIDDNNSCCDYIEIPPVEGMMILFPSWLHHAVIPLSTKPSYQNTDQGLRISLAFNIIQSKK